MVPTGETETTEVYTSPRYRRSPFYDAAKRSGARVYTVYNHMLLPSLYQEAGVGRDSVSEYWHLVRHVGLWDVGAERQVEITGPDAFRFAQFLTPRDLSRCGVGQAVYGVLTAPDGGIVNDAVILRLAEDRFWFSPADGDVLLWAQGVAVHSGMDVQVREPDASPIQVQGPKSRDVVAALAGPSVRELPYYHLMETSLDGIPVVISRTGWTGELGYEIFLRDGRRGTELWEMVVRAGKPFDLWVMGPSNVRRVEAGILNYRTDMTLEDNPFQVGLGWTVELDGPGDFVGKEALRRIKERGVDRKLVGLEVLGEPFKGWLSDFRPVLSDGRVVGRLTVLVHSPRLGKNIGFAMVPANLTKVGTSLTVDLPSGEPEARVARKPFIDPNKDIPRG